MTCLEVYSQKGYQASRSSGDDICLANILSSNLFSRVSKGTKYDKMGESRFKLHVCDRESASIKGGETMKVRVGLENNIEGRSLAWALDCPGCFAYGTDGKSAIVNMAQAVPAYIDWMALHTAQPWFNPEAINIDLVDVWDCYSIDENFNRSTDGYEVNAWFLDDWKPLTEADIERALQILSWTRSDLMETVADLTDEQLDEKRPDERWSIRGIIGHIGKAEWWYLNRLDLVDQDLKDLPTDNFKRIKVVRDLLIKTLPGLAGVEQVVGKQGEFWSPRKILRRSIWHERDHIHHIQRLVFIDR